MEDMEKVEQSIEVDADNQVDNTGNQSSSPTDNQEVGTDNQEGVDTEGQDKSVGKLRSIGTKFKQGATQAAKAIFSSTNRSRLFQALILLVAVAMLVCSLITPIKYESHSLGNVLALTGLKEVEISENTGMPLDPKPYAVNISIWELLTAKGEVPESAQVGLEAMLLTRAKTAIDKVGEDYEEEVIILKAKITDLLLVEGSESKIKGLEKDLEKITNKMCAAVAKEMNINWLKYDMYFNLDYGVSDYQLIMTPILLILRIIAYIVLIIFIMTTVYYLILGRKKISYKLFGAAMTLFILGFLILIMREGLRPSLTFWISYVLALVTLLLTGLYARKIMGLTRKQMRSWRTK